MTFTSRIKPIPLPSGQAVTTGQSAVVTGWGKTTEGGSTSDILQQAAVCVQEPSICGGSNNALTICAGVLSPAIDSCQGDSGGPLAVKGNSGEYFLAGVVSNGVGCVGRGEYTRVSAYETWIQSTIASN